MSLFVALEQFWDSAKSGLNGVLFAMSNKSSSSGRAMFRVGMFVDFLQMTAFVLPNEESFDLEFPTPVKALAMLVRYAQIGTHLINLGGVLPMVIASLFLVVLELGNLFYVGYSWSRMEFRHMWTIRLLRSTMSIFVGVMYIPIVSILSNVFVCKDIPDETTCNVLMPITAICLAAFVAVSLLVSVAMFDPRPTSQSPTARPHSRIHTLHLLAKTTFAFFFTILATPTPSHQLATIWTILTSVWALSLAFLFTWYQPFFRQSSTLFRSVFSNLLAWFSLCAALHVQLPNKDNQTTSITVIGGGLLVIPLSIMIVQFRWYTIKSKPLSRCNNVFEVELKCRIELQGIGPEHITDLHKAESTALKERVATVGQWYTEAATYFPQSSALCVFHAHFLLDFVSDRVPLIRRSIIQAERKGLSIDMNFIIYKTRQLLEESSSKSHDVIAFVRSEKFLKEALAYDRVCSHQLVEFWSELAEKEPDINKVRQLALNIARNTALAQASYSNLIQAAPLSAKAYQLYGSFLIDIMNDTQNGVPMTRKGARMLEDQAKSQSGLGGASPDSLGAIIVRIGEDGAGDIGDIVSANPNAVQMLNMPSHQIIGSKIQTFMVPPFSERFDRIIRDFLQDGDDEHLETVHRTFFRTSTSSLIQVDLKLKVYASDQKDLQIYVLCTQVSGTEDFILIDSKDMIQGFGRSVPVQYSELRLPCSVQTLFPDFRKALDQKSDTPLMAYSSQKKGGTIRLGGLQSVSETQTQAAYTEHHRHEGEPSNSPLDGSACFAENQKVPLPLSLQRVSLTMLGEHFTVLYLGAEDQDDEEGAENYDSDAGSWVSENDQSSSLMVPLFSRGNEVSFQREKSVSKVVRTPSHTSGRPKSIRDGKATASVVSSDVLRAKALAVRRLLAEDQNAAIDPTLAKLRRRFLQMSLLVLGLAIREFFQSSSVLDDYLVNVQFINLLGFRRFCAVTIAFTAHSLNMINKGILPATMETKSREDLAWAADTLKSIDSQLFSKRATVGGELQEMYEEPFTDFGMLRNGELYLDKLNLYDATLRITSIAQQAHINPLDHFTTNNPAAFSLLSNLGITNNTILTGLERTTQLYEEYTRNQLDEVLASFTLSSIITCVIISALICITVYPLVANGGKIENTKREILRVFSEIPKEISKNVTWRYVERLADVHDEEVELPEACGDKNVPHTVSSPRTKAKSGKAGVKVAPLVEHETKKNADRKQQRRRRKDPLSSCLNRISFRKVQIVAKVGLLLVLTVAFYVTGLLALANMGQETIGSPAEANFAGYRRMKSRFVTHELRLFMSGLFIKESALSFDTTSLGGTRDSVRKRIESLLDTHRRLVNGSPEDFIKGTFKSATDESSATLMSIYTEDACIGWPGSRDGTTQEDCRAFENGLMATGLQSALLEFAEEAYQITYDPEILAVVQNGTVEDTRNMFLTNKRLLRLFELEDRFLQIQLTTVIKEQAKITKAKLDSAYSILLITLCTFCGSVLLTYVFIVRTMLMELDTEVKRTRSLLLVIPEDALQNLQHIQRFLVDQFGNAFTSTHFSTSSNASVRR